MDGAAFLLDFAPRFVLLTVTPPVVIVALNRPPCFDSLAGGLLPGSQVAQAPSLGPLCHTTLCLWLHFPFFKLPCRGMLHSHLPSVGSASDYASTSHFVAALMPSHTLLQPRLCFATGLAFLHHLHMLSCHTPWAPTPQP